MSNSSHPFPHRAKNKISIILGLAQSYQNLGDILNARAELDKLNEISIISFTEEEFIGLLKGFLLTARLNLDLNDFETAKKSLEKTELLIRDSNASLENSLPFINLKVSTYVAVHKYFLKTKQNSKARRPLNMAISEQLRLISLDSLNLNSHYGLVELYQHYAKFYQNQNNLDKQEYYWSLCVDVYKNLTLQYQGIEKIECSYVILLYNLASIKFNLYKDSEALKLLGEAKEMLKKIKLNSSFNLQRYRIKELEFLIDSLSMDLQR